MLVTPHVKRTFFLFLAFALNLFSASAQNTDEPYRIKTIVVDAGHGGHDPGNLGTGRYKTKEKDIALDVALRVGGYINKQFPEINVLYTRDTDVFIGLNERADIANKAKADLFLSIHCNSAASTSANGTETFVLGLHKNKENLDVAMKENSAIFLEDDYKTKYEGFDPNSAESIIALTIMQSAYLQQSLTISSYIQQQFKNRVGRRDRGVKQAGFLVLRRTTMPSILIELGFLTNDVEEDFLNSENGKAYMSSAIFRGFKEYKDMVEDPLPEGQTESSTSQAEKQKQLDEAMQKRAQEKLDSIKKVEQETKDKAIADSLKQEKERLELQKKEREAELKRLEEAKQERLKATADSLEQVRLQKLEEMKKRQAEIAAQKAAEEEERKKKEAAARLAKEEEERKAREAKEMAQQVLEEIKEEKERQLQQAKIEAEKQRLEEIKAEKQRQLDEAKAKAESDSLALVKKQEDAREKAERDSIAKVLAEKNEAIQLKQRQDSIAKTREKEAAEIEAKIGQAKAASPKEAELLFLQLRKKQLEQKIAKLKGQNVKPPTEEVLEERAESKHQPEQKVNSKSAEGIVLKVQVLTSSEPLSSNDSRFLGKEVWEYQQGGLYKYTVGSTNNFDEITKLQSELRTLGFKGAFVVAFKDGERIKVSEARTMLNQ